MAKVFIYSIPFGFGPTGKAITIAKRLKATHSVTIASFGHAINLLNKSLEGVQILDCHSREVHLWPQEILNEANIFISIMDLRVVKQFASLYPQRKIIFVDSLLWWRTLHPNSIEHIDFYVTQYFPGVNEVIAKLPEPKLFHIVSPIIGTDFLDAPKLKRQPMILVHYGGLSSPVIKFIHYEPYITKLTDTFIEYSTKFDGLDIVVSGNQEAMDLLKIRFRNIQNAHFECLPYDSFQKCLALADCFITTPGLEAAYESFFLNTPVIFLPPTNSTQLSQVLQFSKFGLAVALGSEEICFLNDLFTLRLPYQQQTKEICKFANELVVEKREELNHRLIKLISTLLTSTGERQRLTRKQSDFIPKDLPDGLSKIEFLVENLDNQWW